MYLKYLSIFTLVLFLAACGGDKPNKGGENNANNNTNNNSSTNTAAAAKDIPSLIIDLDQKYPTEATPTKEVKCLEWGGVSMFMADGKTLDKIRYDYAVGDEGGSQHFYYQDGKLVAMAWRSAYYGMGPNEGEFTEIRYDNRAYFKDGKIEIKALQGQAASDPDGNLLEKLVMKEVEVTAHIKERIEDIKKKFDGIKETDHQKMGEAMCEVLTF